MNFDHAESAVLATVHTAMPQGFALPALNHKGLPEFEVTPAKARELDPTRLVEDQSTLRYDHVAGGDVAHPGRQQVEP